MSKFLVVAFALLPTLVQAQLQARDIDGNGSVDAYYDVQQNISWLADANRYATLGGPLNQGYWANAYDPAYLNPGELRLPNAFTFLAGLNVGGVTGWRLPERLIPAGDPTGTNPRCGPAGTTCDGRWGWDTELTNMLAGNAGAINSFVNVMNGSYMAFSAHDAVNMDFVTLINPYAPSTHSVTDETGLVWGYVWAVHDGDVGNGTTSGPVTPVPEPETYALMLSALAAVGIAQRRTNARNPRPA